MNQYIGMSKGGMPNGGMPKGEKKIEDWNKIGPSLTRIIYS